MDPNPGQPIPITPQSPLNTELSAQQSADTISIAPQAPEPSTLRLIFIGPYGLRAGWSLLLFVAMLIAIIAAINFAGHTYYHHHPAALAARKAQQKLNAGKTTFATDPSDILSTHGIPMVVFLLLSWIMTRIERRRLGVYGFRGTHRVPNCFKGLLTGFLSLSLLVLTLKLTHLLVFDGIALSGSAIILNALKWFAAFCLIGLTEEYMFRGYVQYTLARGLSGILPPDSPYRHMLGFWLAATFFSGIFLFAHTTNPGESPIGLLSVFVVGLVLAYSLWRTGSLWWAIGFHTAWDYSQSYLYGVSDSGMLSNGRLMNSHAVGNKLFSGGFTGPEGSIYILPIMILIVLAIRFTVPAGPLPPLYPEKMPPQDLPLPIPNPGFSESSIAL